MSVEVPFAIRRDRTLDRAVTILSADPRFVAGWLEGSLADGSADSYSDIDLHLCVARDAWDEVWPARRTIVDRIAPILAALDIAGAFGIGCLLEGPVKLDAFFEEQEAIGARQRTAVKPLWGTPELFAGFKVGDDLGDAAIKYALEYNLLGFLQGATWPVRILARGQINTFLFNEILLVETAVIPLMLLQRDRRAFHRNMFTRAKLLTADETAQCSRLVSRILKAVNPPPPFFDMAEDQGRGAVDRIAMRDAHLEIFHLICR